MERIKDVCVGDLGEGVQIQKRGRPIFFGTASSVGQQTLYLDYSIARFILIIIYQEQIIKRPETASTSSGVIIITIIIAMIMMMTITIMMLITITIFNITTMIMIMIIIIIIMIIITIITTIIFITVIIMLVIITLRACRNTPLYLSTPGLL